VDVHVGHSRDAVRQGRDQGKDDEGVHHQQDVLALEGTPQTNGSHYDEDGAPNANADGHGPYHRLSTGEGTQGFGVERGEGHTAGRDG
jgi:hypothetical protein